MKWDFKFTHLEGTSWNGDDDDTGSDLYSLTPFRSLVCRGITVNLLWATWSFPGLASIRCGSKFSLSSFTWCTPLKKGCWWLTMPCENFLDKSESMWKLIEQVDKMYKTTVKFRQKTKKHKMSKWVYHISSQRYNLAC